MIDTIMQTDLDDKIAALAGRVMALTWPCRKTDGDIITMIAGYGWWTVTDDEGFARSRTDSELPRFTASLDAAMTLVPEGWSVLMAFGPKGAVCDVSPEGLGGNGTWPAHARAATPALALTAAALLARAALAE